MAYIDCSKWLDILKERFGVKENLCKFEKPKSSNVYFFENVECESSDGNDDEKIHDFLVFDLLETSIGCYDDYDIDSINSVINIMKNNIDDNICAKIIFIFKDWNEERKFYWKFYENLGAKGKKEFINIYSQKESIYIDSGDIELIVDGRGINYLEYTNSNIHNKLDGWIYNISLYSLKKLYNVTGNRLFFHNIRYSLLDDRIGKSLKDIFKHYIWSDLKKTIEKKYHGKLDTDEVEKTILTKNHFRNYFLAENFWFHHNGITIFCFEYDDSNIKGNTITLNSKKVSVINGAQTLTNFFLAEEEIYKKIIEYFHGDEDTLHDIFAKCLKKIFVKTVIIGGKREYVKSITVGLNTQIPVEEIDILSNSDNIEKINNNLKSRIRILKKGESFYNGISLLEFLKYYLIIEKQPGKSKNFRKTEAEKYIEKLVEKGDLCQLADDILNVKKIYAWWDNTERDRYYIDELYYYENHMIARYGKNYFATYALANINDYNFSLDYDSLRFLYNGFVNKFYKSEIELDLGVFKKDDFIKILFTDSSWNQKNNLELDLKQQISERLITLKIKNIEEVTNFINKILCENSIKISNLHIIMKKDGLYYPDFYFSNKSFEEIVNDIPENRTYKEFNSSEFFKELNEEKVFVVVETNDKDECINVNFVDKKIADVESLIQDAKEFYDNIIKISNSGNSRKLEENSNKKGFYLANREFSNEMFEFSDGEYVFYKNIAMEKEKISQLLNN